MNIRIVPLISLSLWLLAATTSAQVQMHSDYGGYSIRTGNSVYSFRDDGTQQTYHRFGNIGLYSDNAGTTGDSLYLSNGRYDFYQNARRGWSGSGFTPYGRNAASGTYSRSSIQDAEFGLPPLPELPRIEDGYGSYSRRATPSYSAGATYSSLAAPGASHSSGGLDTASRLQRLGVRVNAANYTQSELLDIESRVSCSQRIARLGLRLRWEDYTRSELLNIESRVSCQMRIERMGEKIDWQTHTLTELLDIESRIASASRLKRKGITVNWRRHTLGELLDIERIR